jgi:hypothetical protein
MLKRIAAVSMALLLTTSTVLASGIPVGCTDGTREEPVPPTITPVDPTVIPGTVTPNPDKRISSPHFTWNGDVANVRGRPHCVYQLWNGDTRPNRALRPDCLTPWDFKTGSGVGRKAKMVPQPPTIGEPTIIENPPIITDNPPLVVPTKTVKWLVGVSGPWWDPTPVYDETTSDGSCH